MTQVPPMYHDCRCGHIRALHVTEIQMLATRRTLNPIRRLFARRQAHCKGCGNDVIGLNTHVDARHSFALRFVPCDICGANLVTDRHFHPDWPYDNRRGEDPLLSWMDGTVPAWMTRAGGIA